MITLKDSIRIHKCSKCGERAICEWDTDYSINPPIKTFKTTCVPCKHITGFACHVTTEQFDIRMRATQ